MSEFPQSLLPTAIAPEDVVRRFAEQQLLNPRSLILEVGCGDTARNSFYLASLGHKVIGSDIDKDELAKAGEVQRALDVGSCALMGADIRCHPFRTTFDAVVMTNVLQDMPKQQTYAMLQAAQRLTRPGGYNVVSGYMLPSGPLRPRNAERLLLPDELRTIYTLSGWGIVAHTQNFKPAIKTRQGRIDNPSKASIIAMRA